MEVYSRPIVPRVILVPSSETFGEFPDAEAEVPF